MSYCYKPSLIRELQSELFPLMGLHSPTQTQAMESAWAPKVDIKEEGDEFVVYADIPGVDPKDIEIKMENNTLIVQGEKKTVKEEKEKNYYRMERTAGKFYRQFTLPETVDGNKITAKSKHGVLAIHLPKTKEANLQRKIEVKEVE
ncbi:MAG: Hsp20/alpha crystallin family protein [Proteobacteria bacterium]|nr:Hsp20/alpha crystallin family protein [Pseudomonadota bacterium]